jgi:hypothetical protein
MARESKATPVGVWVPAEDDGTIHDTFAFKANGTGISRLGHSDVVWTFHWSQSGDRIAVKQDAGAKLTIRATLLEKGKTLRVYSTTNATRFTDYKTAGDPDLDLRRAIVGTWEIRRWTADDGTDFSQSVDYRGWTRQFTADGTMKTRSVGDAEVKSYEFVAPTTIETVRIFQEEPVPGTRKRESIVMTKDKLIILSPEGLMEL